MGKEQTDTSEKPSVKKWGIIGAILLILIAFIAGISIYSAPANRLSRQLDLGNRYLEEQNYEQAIVEFDKAIAIDPMSVEAYQGKADAYIGLDDLRSALDTLQTGYDLTGDERLKARIDEIQVQSEQINQPGEAVQPAEEMEMQKSQGYLELPFSVSDFKIMGFDLMEAPFDELVDAFGIPMEYRTGMYSGQIDNPYGVNVDIILMRKPTATYESSHAYANKTDTGNSIAISAQCWVSDGTDGYYYDETLWHYGESDYGHSALVISNIMNRNDMEAVCDLPIFPEDTYDEWCEKMGVETIKSSIEGERYWGDISDSLKILSGDGWYVDRYSESVQIYDDYGENTIADISLFNETGAELLIRAIFDSGIIREIEVIWD